MLTSIAFALMIQGAAAPPTQVPLERPQANIEDVKSVDAIINTLYTVISGPIGQKRDWGRFRSIFAPNGKLAAMVKNREDKMVIVNMTPEDYIARNSLYLEEKGFFEREAKRKSQQVGDIVHVFSDYESRMKADDKKPFQEGTNAIQLYTDGTRWYIVSVLWQSK